MSAHVFEAPRADATGRHPGPNRQPQSLMQPVRRALFDLDPDVPAGLRPMTDILRESTGLWAISSLFLGIFGMVALALAAGQSIGVIRES